MSEIVPVLTEADDNSSEITPDLEAQITTYLPAVFDGSLSLDELTKKIFKDDKLDGRSKKGRSLRKWLIDKGHKIKTSKYEKEGPFEPEEENKEFVLNNIDNMRPMEMARMLWPNKKITPLNREFIWLQNFIRELRPEAIPESDRSADESYEPPKSIYRLIPRINNYIGKFKIEDAKPFPQDEKLLNERDLKNLKKLLGYLNNDTFILSINIYSLVQERELFESKFIRYTYDKPDLTEEEIDQYIAVCDKSVALHQIRRNIQVLQREINLNLETGDPEKKKVAMSFIELLNSYRQKETDAEDRLEKTVKNLSGTRSERLKGRLANNATIMNLVLAFQAEQSRKELLELAKKQRAAEKEVVTKLSNMDAVVALLAGYGKEEI